MRNQLPGKRRAAPVFQHGRAVLSRPHGTHDPQGCLQREEIHADPDPIVGKQYETVHHVHRRGDETDARRGIAMTKQIHPFLFGQGTPTAVFLVAAIDDGVVAPVGLASLVV